MVSHLVSHFIQAAIAAIAKKVNKPNKTPETSSAECLDSLSPDTFSSLLHASVLLRHTCPNLALQKGVGYVPACSAFANCHVVQSPKNQGGGGGRGAPPTPVLVKIKAQIAVPHDAGPRLQHLRAHLPLGILATPDPELRGIRIWPQCLSDTGYLPARATHLDRRYQLCSTQGTESGHYFILISVLQLYVQSLFWISVKSYQNK